MSHQQQRRRKKNNRSCYADRFIRYESIDALSGSSVLSIIPQSRSFEFSSQHDANHPLRIDQLTQSPCSDLLVVTLFVVKFRAEIGHRVHIRSFVADDRRSRLQTDSRANQDMRHI